MERGGGGGGGGGGGSLQEQRVRANERAGERQNERKRRQERKRAAETGDVAGGEGEGKGSGAGAEPEDEYGSLRLGASAKAFVSTAGQHGYVCMLCRVTLPSLELYEQHIAGSTHAKAVRAQEEERDRQRRGIGSAHDALAAAQWSARATNGSAKHASTNGQVMTHAMDAAMAPATAMATATVAGGGRRGGEEVFRPPAAGAPRLMSTTTTTTTTTTAADGSGKGVEDSEADALPTHISTRKKKKVAEPDLSIDGWLPPLPTVRAIDERLVLPADVRQRSGGGGGAVGTSAEQGQGEQEKEKEKENAHQLANGAGRNGSGRMDTPPGDAHPPPGFALVAYDDDDDDDD